MSGTFCRHLWFHKKISDSIKKRMMNTQTLEDVPKCFQIKILCRLCVLTFLISICSSYQLSKNFRVRFFIPFRLILDLKTTIQIDIFGNISAHLSRFEYSYFYLKRIMLIFASKLRYGEIATKFQSNRSLDKDLVQIKKVKIPSHVFFLYPPQSGKIKKVQYRW